MKKHRSVATMRIVGGHPGLDLANTVDCRHGHFGPDLLVTYVDLVDWAERAGLLGAELAAEARLRAAAATREAEAELARAKRLREAVYRVFSASAAGRDPPAPDLALIGEEARQAQARRHLVWTGQGCAWAWSSGHDQGAIVGMVAHAVAELLTAAQVVRVKECFGRNCGWLFLDASRNGRRRWCSEEGCGTRGRVARHRARARGNEAGGPSGG